jgi:hypothetical protein
VGVVCDRRLDLSLRTVICDCAIVITLGLKGAAAAKIGFCVLRIDLDCLTIVCNCAVGFAFGSVGGSTVVVSFGKPWVDVERMARSFSPLVL